MFRILSVGAFLAILVLSRAVLCAETNDLIVHLEALQESRSQQEAMLSRQVNELRWRDELKDIAIVEKVRFTGPPPREREGTFQNASNHVIVSAMTFYPRRTSLRSKRALVVLAHGEVHGNVATDEECQIARELVERGYAVIAPDYRGSSGYGVDYWKQIDYGGLEIEDMEAARQFMLERDSHLDPKRVAIIGWSHGGLIALMTVFHHPQYYRACYAGAPVCALEERIRIRGAEYEKLFSDAYHLGRTPAEAPDEYRRRSPAYNADKLQTPLLLHANTNDEDVKFAEVVRLIDALRAARKTFDYRIYTNAPGGHQWNRLDTEQARASRREIWGFLDRHLRE